MVPLSGPYCLSGMTMKKTRTERQYDYSAPFGNVAELAGWEALKPGVECCYGLPRDPLRQHTSTAANKTNPRLLLRRTTTGVTSPNSRAGFKLDETACEFSR